MTIREVLNHYRLNLFSLIRKYKIRLLVKEDDIRHLRVNYVCKRKWYGSVYGGFFINPTLLNNESIVLSFGIGKDVSFDMKCIKKHGCKVFGFDPTPNSIDWVKANVRNKNFIFFPWGIGTESSRQLFYLPKNRKAISGSLILNDAVDQSRDISVELKSIADIVSLLKLDRIDVLKMDIEGSEYEVLRCIVDSDIAVQQILVEFHDRMFDSSSPKSLDIVNYLNEKGYVIFAHSVNYEEISFLKR